MNVRNWLQMVVIDHLAHGEAAAELVSGYSPVGRPFPAGCAMALTAAGESEPSPLERAPLDRYFATPTVPHAPVRHLRSRTSSRSSTTLRSTRY